MESQNQPKKHGIQLVGLQVAEMSIKVNSLDEAKLLDSGDFKLEIARSDYDSEDKQIHVSAAISIGADESESSSLPFKMNISINGLFSVNEDLFDSKYVEDWAEKAAMYVLYPYLREIAYSLTSKCGIDAVVLPLFEVPTYKIAKS